MSHARAASGIDVQGRKFDGDGQTVLGRPVAHEAPGHVVEVALDLSDRDHVAPAVAVGQVVHLVLALARPGGGI
ncbi:MAG: hypothetical protein ACRDWI_19575, partial [Jiangellaceae bacterium]